MQIAGAKCGLCGDAIAFAADGRVCPTCVKPYHIKCLPGDGLCPECKVAVVREEDVETRDEPAAAVRRPTSVTVVCWFLVISGVLSVLSGMMTMNNPMARELMAKSPIPIPVQMAMIFVGAAISVVSGIAMLRGLKWARTLYIVWCVAGIVVSLATSPMKLLILPSAVFLLLIIYFLMRKPAQEFFAGT